MSSKKFNVLDTDLPIEDIAEMVEGIEAKADFNLKQIPLKEIKLNKLNDFDTSDITDLLESMAKYGQIHNALVRVIDDSEFKYEMISGERRYRTALQLGWTTLTCKIVEVDDIDAEIMLRVANIHARSLNDMVRSANAIRLVELYNLKRKNDKSIVGKKTRELVAEEMKIAPATVQKLITLEKLIPDFKAMVESGEIGLELANQYAQMDVDMQKLVYKSIREGLKYSAKTAKVIKDKSKEEGADYKKIIEDMKQEIVNKDIELNKAKDEAMFKIKAIQDENNELKARADKLENNWNKANEELQSAREILNKKELELKDSTEKIRAELEAELKKNYENEENNPKIKQLKEELRVAQEKENNAKKESLSKIGELNKQIKNIEEEKKSLEDVINKKAKEEKKKEIDENNIVLNVELVALAKQTKQLLYQLVTKVSEYKSKEGFELSEDALRAISEVTKANDDVVK